AYRKNQANSGSACRARSAHTALGPRRRGDIPEEVNWHSARGEPIPAIVTKSARVGSDSLRGVNKSGSESLRGVNKSGSESVRGSHSDRHGSGYSLAS